MTGAAARRLGLPQWVAVAAAVAAGALAFLPAPEGIAPATARAAGVVVLAIALWATAAVPAYLTSIVFLFLAAIAAVAPPEIVFAGFYSSAVWLVFGGLIIGLAVQESGLGARAVRVMLRHAPRSYLGVAYGLALVGAALAFFVPSAVGRIVLLIPIVLVFAEQLGFSPGGRGRAGLVLAAAAGTMFPAFGILPANVPNMALVGASESIYGITFTYARYLVLNLPVMGLLGLAAIPLLVNALFREAPRATAPGGPQGPWSTRERRLLAVMVVALALWATDFLHGIAPAWVALGAGIVCVLPRLGVLPTTALTSKIDYGPWFFVAGVISLGAVANHAGVAQVIADALMTVFDLRPAGAPAAFAALVLMGMAVALVTTLPASPAIMTPLAATLAAATAWPLESVLLAQVPVWMAFPFPYQAPPIVVAIALGGVAIGPATRFLCAYLALYLAVILPLQYLWGRTLGVYP